MSRSEALSASLNTYVPAGNACPGISIGSLKVKTILWSRASAFARLDRTLVRPITASAAISSLLIWILLSWSHVEAIAECLDAQTHRQLQYMQNKEPIMFWFIHLLAEDRTSIRRAHSSV